MTHEPVNVTLDIASYNMPVSEFIDWIRGGLGGEFVKVADDIEEQVKPAIPEPLEFASVVKGKDGQLYVRRGALIEFPWVSGDEELRWDEVEAAEVLRVGVGGEYSPSLQQIRDLLFRSPSGHLTNEETLAAYKDLRKGLSDLLSANATPEPVVCNCNYAAGHHPNCDVRLPVELRSGPRFCTRSQNCRMAEGHEGGCQR